jgi:hypothetical protein
VLAYGWAMRGFQGVIAMLTTATQEGVVMETAHLEELRTWRTAIDRVIENQERLRAAREGVAQPAAVQPPDGRRRRPR